MRINPALADLAKVTDTVKPAGGAEKGNGDFAQTLMDVLKEVNSAQGDAQAKRDAFLANRQSVEYHDLMITMERASTALQLTLQVRNKLLEAYQEINRMPI